MPLSGDLLNTAMASIAFVGCALGSVAPVPPPTAATRRREVVVAGRRVKTIDIHAHCIVPAAAAVINHPLEAPGLLMNDTSVRLAAMDAQGIDVEALSINPFWYRAERDAAAELIRLQNEALVQFCAASPDRFVAFATAALQFPELAAEQVEHYWGALLADVPFSEYATNWLCEAQPILRNELVLHSKAIPTQWIGLVCEANPMHH